MCGWEEYALVQDSTFIFCKHFFNFRNPYFYRLGCVTCVMVKAPYRMVFGQAILVYVRMHVCVYTYVCVCSVSLPLGRSSAVWEGGRLGQPTPASFPNGRLVAWRLRSKVHGGCAWISPSWMITKKHRLWVLGKSTVRQEGVALR